VVPTLKQKQIVKRTKLDNIISQKKDINENTALQSLDSNDEPIKILCSLVKKHDIYSLFANPTLFNSLLKDYYMSKYKSESMILGVSISENIPQDLLSKKDTIPFSILSAQLINRLNNCGFSANLSEWVIKAWVKALDVKVDI
jgi:hypothetical protein